jgi:diguanylate cyclase (GGDEF)-like protein
MPDGQQSYDIGVASAGGADHLQALQHFDILGLGPEEMFDRIASLCRRVMRVQTATISMVETQRHWFKSHIGLEADQTLHVAPFCVEVVAAGTPVMVADASADERFSANPLVTEAPHARFFLGVPLVTPDGLTIGTMCVIDSAAREASPEQIDLLVELAALVVDEVELRRLADSDRLTGAMTRRAFLRDGRRVLAQAQRAGTTLSYITLEIDDFRALCERHGHAVGDQVLRCVASICQTNMRATDVIGRVGGEQFSILLPGASVQDAIMTAERLDQRIADAVIDAPEGRVRLTASFGLNCFDGRTTDLESIAAAADESMRTARSNGEDRVALSLSVIDAYAQFLADHNSANEIDLLLSAFDPRVDRLN